MRSTYIPRFPSRLVISTTPLTLRFYSKPSLPPLKVLNLSHLKYPTSYWLDRPYRISAIIAQSFQVGPLTIKVLYLLTC